MREVLTKIEGEETPMPPKTTSFNVDLSTMPPSNEEHIHESMRAITEEVALERLESFLDMPGMLQIITNECTSPGCGDGVHDESEFPLTDHRHFVKHDVVAIDQEPSTGAIRAHSAEGDWTISPSGARSLLRHLTRVSLGSG